MQLDLANLESIHGFCEHFLKTGSTLDLLINNAGTFRRFGLLGSLGAEACSAAAGLCTLKLLSCRSGG